MYAVWFVVVVILWYYVAGCCYSARVLGILAGGVRFYSVLES